MSVSARVPARVRTTTATSWTAALAALLVVSCAAGVAIGAADLSIGTVVEAIAGRLGVGAGTDLLTTHIVVDLRLPRVLAAALVGAGLALCGAVLQSLTGNALADPYLLGMSGGASLGAVLALTAGVGTVGVLGMSAVSVAAFVAALASLLVVFLISTSPSGALLPGRLVLAGIAVGQFAAALTSALVFFGDRDAAHRVLQWTLGSFAGARWSGLVTITAVVAVTTGVLLAHARVLDSFAFGARAAASLGTDVERSRWVLYGIASLCTAALVAQSGVIGFVGLVVPHAARMLVGPLHARLLPVVALAGAVLLVWADIAARTVMPGRELPISIVTAVVGVPVFVLLLRRRGARA
ncbi:iron ABC transporter permease [Prescottella equi]|uniref:Iron chelate uptake ABC transporter, FeCT family, permease protein n=2 Tax=Rhodococcus hoagii TaxID=43767 RepID=E9T0X5_RHOHA|nr:iron chelate uptake ABC transporter family permease subunit [Prescottella equi]MBU4613323.1 iron chelate uptake ABC transporter family permease subunit [Rhodococcus sp. GG48]EGD24076.1 iron chelate uptake ABC transporter, FeCT family, permease protein [Prescottella equi ATCC 33707]ERN47088.1 ABC transporter transmembrane protein [Prescottella equi NBRC 101255 = C 7]MBM4626771.1 iron chelate uptake ABC transporter family permease subunit [Prescottella equi]MBM4723097.1 iron chelate uptake AB